MVDAEFPFAARACQLPRGCVRRAVDLRPSRRGAHDIAVLKAVHHRDAAPEEPEQGPGKICVLETCLSVEKEQGGGGDNNASRDSMLDHWIQLDELTSTGLLSWSGKGLEFVGPVPEMMMCASRQYRTVHC